MNEFVAVVGIAAFAAGLTYLGVPAAERFDVPHRLVSAALQFAAGIVTALVAVTLMPPAMRNGPYVWAVLAFFAGGVLYVLLEYFTKRAQAERRPERAPRARPAAPGSRWACSPASWSTCSSMAWSSASGRPWTC